MGRQGGSPGWVARVGCQGGSPGLPEPGVGRRGGSPGWVARVGRRGGSPRWGAGVAGAQGGSPGWVARVCRSGGSSGWVAKVGTGGTPNPCDPCRGWRHLPLQNCRFEGGHVTILERGVTDWGVPPPRPTRDPPGRRQQQRTTMNNNNTNNPAGPQANAPEQLIRYARASPPHSDPRAGNTRVRAPQLLVLQVRTLSVRKNLPSLSL